MTEFRPAANVDTTISDVDSGTVRYSGYDIRDLAGLSTFEETVFLLHHGRLPSLEDLEILAERLTIERELDPWLGGLMPALSEVTSPMSMLRTAISAASTHDPDGRDHSAEATERKAIRLIARVPTLVAAFHRLRSGVEAVPPDPKLPHAANFLYMLTAQEPDEEAARALDVCLILGADRGVDPSTFAARLVASTSSDIHAAITAAVGALGGPPLGGEREGAPHGMGEAGPDELRRRVERTMLEVAALSDAGLPSVYHALGIPPELFPCVKAVARVAGWTAHVREQLAGGRPLRPGSRYVGPPARPYVPIEDRGRPQA